MNKEEYKKYISQMFDALNEQDLRQIYTIVHIKYIHRRSEQENKSK